MSRLVALLAVVLVIALAVGASAREDLTPLDGVRVGAVRYVTTGTVRDARLEKAIIAALDVSATSVTYVYYRVALHGTKPDQVIVLAQGPLVCGTGGCPAFVFERSPAGYRLVTAFTLVHAPIVVLGESRHGWHSLAWAVGGGGMAAHYVRLEFDGHTYPENPSVAPAFARGSVLTGTALTDAGGLELRIP